MTLKNVAVPVVSARIDSYSPSSSSNPATVQVGDSVTIRVTFTNTGNTPWRFIAGASVWNSTGQIVGDYDTTLGTELQPGQQTTVSWSHTVNQAGDFWLQFGVWKQTPYTSSNLLDKEPSPSQRLIVGVANEPPTARFSMSAQENTAYENQTLDLEMESGQVLTVQFSASRSYDDSSISSYEWKVDGSTVSRNRDCSWQFDLFKTYQIFLTVIDSHGSSNSVGGQVRISQIDEPEYVDARIDSYSPSSSSNPVAVQVGNSVTIRVNFTNTGNTPWRFIAGASVWNSSGQIVGDYDTTLGSLLQPGQQTTVSWSHTVNQAGDFWLQFGVWKQTPYTSLNLLDKEPSPSQRLIVGVAAGIQVGDRVRANQNLNVRTCPDTSCSEISDSDYPGYAPTGAYGTVIDGPESADGYVWWKVQYDPGYAGWSVENGLEEL